MQLEPGAKLGPYEIVSSIGVGGMGQVWKARDSRLDRIVAVKVSHEQFSARFEQEARAVAALNHTNICTLHDVGPNYLVMEYLEGDTLAARIASGPLPLDGVLSLGIQIAYALDAAHRKGIVHRDLKPANVMLTRSGAKLLDFGLARIKNTGTSPGENVTQAMTNPGTILGTFQYMAPEIGSQGSRRPLGHLRLWRAVVRNADRPQSVRGQEPGQLDRSNSYDGSPADLERSI